MNAPAVRQGFPDADRAVAAALFWAAFKDKMSWPMGPEAKALEFLQGAVDPDHAFAVHDENGALIGLAGFQDAEGPFVGGSMRDLARVYGWVGALWRGVLLSLFERKTEEGTLLMDGIFVAPEARGRGVGSALLNRIKSYALESGHRHVRLDVIDTNPRARALYERQGFHATKTEKLDPVLARIFGFQTSTTMICDLSYDLDPS